MKDTKTSFMFTNKNVRELAKKDNGTITDIYYDAGCPHLSLNVSTTWNVYIYRSKKVAKMIGNVWRVSVEEARKIVHNIDDNEEEFLSLNIPKRHTVFDDFQKNGYLPRQKNEGLDKIKSTATILSSENISLKKNINELEEKIAELEGKIEKQKDSMFQAIQALSGVDF